MTTARTATFWYSAAMQPAPSSPAHKIIHNLATITNPDDLIRYAVHSQLEYVNLRQAHAAEAIGLKSYTLNRCLAGERRFSID